MPDSSCKELYPQHKKYFGRRSPLKELAFSDLMKKEREKKEKKKRREREREERERREREREREREKRERERGKIRDFLLLF